MRGTELAISEVNAAGGLKNHGGALIELVKGDSQSKPVNAVGETERLINQDKVALIIGAGTSNETIPLSQVAEKYGVWQKKSLYGRSFMGNVRTTYLIDRDGKVVRRWDKVKVDGHADAVLDAANNPGRSDGHKGKA